MLDWWDSSNAFLIALLSSYQSNEIKNKEKDSGERCDSVGFQLSSSILRPAFKVPHKNPIIEKLFSPSKQASVKEGIKWSWRWWRYYQNYNYCCVIFFSSKREPVPLQGPAGCIHAQLPGVFVLPPLLYPWEQKHPEAALPSPWEVLIPQGAAHPAPDDSRSSQGQVQKAAASAPPPREVTKKVFKNLFKITYSLL